MGACCLHNGQQLMHDALSGSKWVVAAAQGDWMMHLRHEVVGTSCGTVQGLRFLERYQAYRGLVIDVGLGRNGM